MYKRQGGKRRLSPLTAAVPNAMPLVAAALLVKASRGMALEKVLEIFYAEQKDAEK